MLDAQLVLDCIRIESTDGNFGTREKVAIPILRVLFPFPFLAYLCSHSYDASDLIPIHVPLPEFIPIPKG